MSPTDEGFVVTAISAVDGRSTIECWHLDAPVQISSVPGTDGASNTNLGPVTSLAYTVIPSHFDGGLHNAPCAQFVSFLSGQAVVTIPGTDEEAIIEGGANGLIIAVDTSDVSKEGHRTTYPGDTPTVALQLPFPGGKIPPHKMRKEGVVANNDVVGNDSVAVTGLLALTFGGKGCIDFATDDVSLPGEERGELHLASKVDLAEHTISVL
ncbi:hypothetical protein HIM_04391 [Hirsutella minnesotensis 3608]|uniref:Uncharacterized protein n=1 Tax=Hirsutella minnesotensis 3608 TaxID=1043627 RepID=A0A0F8A619_9HYPO|nr:hypothetical protein HIM_04391 [Hirsutella minnesotensis 3608]